MSNHSFAVALTTCALLFASQVATQAAGSRGGLHVGGETTEQSGPDAFAVEHYITIAGRAEVRVRPSKLRVVLAITSQDESASGCQSANAAKQSALLAELRKLGVADAAVHLDFISMLPVYEWRVEDQAGKRVATERRSGYRLQTNAHVEVGSEREARAAIGAAFGIGIANVIAVDYWSDALDQAKQQAQAKALAEAQRKSKLLLGAVFEQRPKPINVHEDTRVKYPADMYQSFETAYASNYQQGYRSRENLPTIAAFRPKNTYYHGFFERVDIATPELPMRPEISVVSTIKIYYAAPDRPRPAGTNSAAK